MTDRIQNLTVILDQDYRDDDAQAIIAAISLLRGVARVIPGKPVNIIDHMARERAKNDLRTKIFDALNPEIVET
jgi:hypothetical protein